MVVAVMAGDLVVGVLGGGGMGMGMGMQPTLGEYGCQLGEFRLFSVGDISLNGRGSGLAIVFFGEGVGVFLEMRRGCT